jgi:hypothetical protein
MSTKNREVIWGGRIMGADMRAQAARQDAKKAARAADRAEAEAWSVRMEGYGGPAQPSPTIDQCLNGGANDPFGHDERDWQCPFSRAERKWRRSAATSPFDPEQSSRWNRDLAKTLSKLTCPEPPPLSGWPAPMAKRVPSQPTNKSKVLPNDGPQDYNLRPH